MGIEGVAKTLSQARRCFKFFRWLKHFEDLPVARCESNTIVSGILMVDIMCNICADISEDICSLERLGVMSKGTLPDWAEYYANFCQLVLAVVEIVVASIRA